MKERQVEFGIERARSSLAFGDGINLCGVARAVLAFLEALSEGASWWEKIFLGQVRKYVRSYIERRKCA